MSQKLPLIGKTATELSHTLQTLGFPAYRGRQLADWIYKKSTRSFSEINNLPQPLLSALADDFSISPLELADHKRSSDDVDKLLVHNGDGQVYECVLLPYPDRVSCCLSSQVGCPMGCTFCATGLGGFDRNLSTAEIVGQYLWLQSLTPRRISHVVFMGMGEPLLNYSSLLQSMKILQEEVGLSYRHITVSTVGLVPQIQKLSQEGLPIHLALSLHSPFDEVRSNLMPVNHKWPVQEVWQAMKDYQKSTGRKVTIEYLLIRGVNDTLDQAKALADLVKGTPCFVNLIPFNWVDTGQGFTRPGQKRVDAFRNVLTHKGINVTQRVERGHDIAAACGQLAGQHQGKFSRRNLSEIPLSP